MQTNISSTCNNISHYGYLKDRRILERNVQKAKFKHSSNPTSNQRDLLVQAEAELKKFLKNNIFKTILCQMPEIFGKLIDFISLVKGAINIRGNIFAHKESFKLTSLASKKFAELKFNVDGEELSFSEVGSRLSVEKDIEKRDSLYLSLLETFNTFEPEMRSLILKRNKIAKKMGYKNFYEYQLKVFGTSEEEVSKIIKEYCQKTDIKSAIQKRKEIVAKHYNTDIDKLTFAQITTSLSKLTKIDDYIQTTEKIYSITKDVYKRMGFDIDNLEQEEKIVYDLRPRNNKISRGICRNLIKGDMVGIEAQLNSGERDFTILMHEMGHGLHMLGSSNFLPKRLKQPKAHMTEAIALMFEALKYRESIFDDIAPKKVLDEFKEYAQLDEINDVVNLIVKAEFESEIYKNPNQDFGKLYGKIYQKYTQDNQKENAWFVLHLLVSPGYIQNYIRGFVLERRIYDAAREKLGTELSQNPKTADFLTKRIFKFGKLIDEKLLSLTLKL